MCKSENVSGFRWCIWSVKTRFIPDFDNPFPVPGMENCIPKFWEWEWKISFPTFGNGNEKNHSQFSGTGIYSYRRPIFPGMVGKGPCKKFYIFVRECFPNSYRLRPQPLGPAGLDEMQPPASGFVRARAGRRSATTTTHPPSCLSSAASHPPSPPSSWSELSKEFWAASKQPTSERGDQPQSSGFLSLSEILGALQSVVAPSQPTIITHKAHPLIYQDEVAGSRSFTLPVKNITVASQFVRRGQFVKCSSLNLGSVEPWCSCSLGTEAAATLGQGLTLWPGAPTQVRAPTLVRGLLS